MASRWHPSVSGPIIAHGLFATVTIVFVVLTALDMGGS